MYWKHFANITNIFVWCQKTARLQYANLGLKEPDIRTRNSESDMFVAFLLCIITAANCIDQHILARVLLKLASDPLSFPAMRIPIFISLTEHKPITHKEFKNVIRQKPLFLSAAW